MGIKKAILGFFKQRELYHLVAVICIAFELVWYLFAGIKGGGILELNNHQLSYTAYLIVNLIALQSSYVLGVRFNWFVICFCITNTIGLCVYLLFEINYSFGIHLLFGYDKSVFEYASLEIDLYYYASQIPSTMVYIPVFWYFRFLRDTIFYKMIAALVVVSSTSTIVFLIDIIHCLHLGLPTARLDYGTFTSFSIGMYALYSMVLVDHNVRVYTSIFKNKPKEESLKFENANYMRTL